MTTESKPTVEAVKPTIAGKIGAWYHAQPLWKQCLAIGTTSAVLAAGTTIAAIKVVGKFK